MNPPTPDASSNAYRAVWRIAAPLIVSNLSVPLLGLVDTAVLGHLDAPQYLGAVAVASLVFSFLFWGFGFLRMGTTGLTAQAHGADDRAEMRAMLGRALLLAGLIGAGLIALQVPIGALAFSLLGVSDDVEGLARQYYTVRVWSAPATLANYALLGWFLGMQNARNPLYVVVATNLVNVALDLLFVVGLGWKVEGVALASVIAEYAGLAWGLVFVAAELRRYPGRWSCHALADLGRVRTMLRVNRHIFVRTLALIFGFAFFTAQGAALGDVVLAANAVLLNFQTFMAYALDGFAHAAEALTGHAIGRRDARAFQSAVRAAAVWSTALAALFALAYAFAGPLIVASLTDLSAVRANALRYLPWMAVAPLVSVWGYLFDGIFIGATRTREMRDTMLVSLGVYLLAWYLARPLANHGLWLALMVFMGARGASMAWVYRRLRPGFANPAAGGGAVR